MLRSKVCRQCGGLNSAEQSECYRCGASFPRGWESTLHSLWTALLGEAVPVTRLYVGACLLIYLALVLEGGSGGLMGGFTRSSILRWGALRACDGFDEPWRLLSPMFLHAGVLHLAMNLMALVDLGRLLEPTLGSVRYALVLLVSVAIGFFASQLWYSHWASAAVYCELPELSMLRMQHAPVTVGISGGLCGLLGAWVGELYFRKDTRWKTVVSRVVVYTVLLSLIFPLNNAAHLGGGLAGGLLGYWFARDNRPWRRSRFLKWAASALVVFSFASIALSLNSDAWRNQRALELLQQRRR